MKVEETEEKGSVTFKPEEKSLTEVQYLHSDQASSALREAWDNVGTFLQSLDTQI